MEIAQLEQAMLLVFNHLDLTTLVSCRLLAKNFKLLIDTKLRVHDLVVYDHFDFDNRWKVDHELVAYRRSLVRTLKLPTRSPLLKELRRLKINNLRHDDLIRLEVFQPTLVYLEIERFELFDLGDEDTINLQSVQFFSVLNLICSKRENALLVNSPALQAAKFSNGAINFFKFKDSSRVHYLEFDRGNVQSSEYPNLRHLVVNQVLENNPDTLLKFAALPNMAKISCNVREMTDASPLSLDAVQLNGLKTFFEMFVKQVQTEVKPNLEIRIHDVLLQPKKEFDQYRFDRSLVDTHLTNFETLPHRVTSIANLDYLHLIRTVTGDRRLQILEKYVNIRRVFFLNPRNEPPPIQSTELIEFLAGCRGIQTLCLDYTGFGNTFYQKLFALPSIFALNFLRCFESQAIDLSSALEFEYLRGLWTNVFRKEEILAVLQKVKCSSRCEFVFGERDSLEEKLFHFEKSKPDCYKINMFRMDHEAEPVAKTLLATFGEMSTSQIQSEILHEPAYSNMFKHFLDPVEPSVPPS